MTPRNRSVENTTLEVSPEGLAYAGALDDHPDNSTQIAQPGGPIMCRRFALSILTAVPLALAAGHAGAADIYVVGAGAIEEPFEALTAEFSRETGHKVHAIFGPVGGMQ